MARFANPLVGAVVGGVLTLENLIFGTPALGKQDYFPEIPFGSTFEAPCNPKEQCSYKTYLKNGPDLEVQINGEWEYVPNLPEERNEAYAAYRQLKKAKPGTHREIRIPSGQQILPFEEFRDYRTRGTLEFEASIDLETAYTVLKFAPSNPQVLKFLDRLKSLLIFLEKNRMFYKDSPKNLYLRFYNGIFPTAHPNDIEEYFIPQVIEAYIYVGRDKHSGQPNLSKEPFAYFFMLDPNLNDPRMDFQLKNKLLLDPKMDGLNGNETVVDLANLL